MSEKLANLIVHADEALAVLKSILNKIHNEESSVELINEQKKSYAMGLLTGVELYLDFLKGPDEYNDSRATINLRFYFPLYLKGGTSRDYAQREVSHALRDSETSLKDPIKVGKNYVWLASEEIEYTNSESHLGRIARYHDIALADNPFIEGSDFAREWEAGWKNRDMELKNA